MRSEGYNSRSARVCLSVCLSVYISVCLVLCHYRQLFIAPRVLDFSTFHYVMVLHFSGFHILYYFFQIQEDYRSIKL